MKGLLRFLIRILCGGGGNVQVDHGEEVSCTETSDKKAEETDSGTVCDRE